MGDPTRRRRWRRRLACGAVMVLALAGAAWWRAIARSSDSDADPRVWMADAADCKQRARLASATPAPLVALAENEAKPALSPYGVLLFAYSNDSARVELFTGEALRAAYALKRTNPRLPVALATTHPNQSAVRDGPFDHVLPMRHDHVHYPGWGPPRREWLSRLHYLALSPYDLTLALDSQALPCTAADDADDDTGAARIGGGEIEAVLAHLPPYLSAARWFDMAYNTVFFDGRPHNWALLYYPRAPGMRALFTDWYVHYVNLGHNDQDALLDVARRHVRSGAVRVARLHANFASAFAPITERDKLRTWPRATQLLTGRVLLFHLRFGHERERRALCRVINAEKTRRRVLVQPRGGNRKLYTGAWPTAYDDASFQAATGYWPPPRGDVNELVWAPAPCSHGGFGVQGIKMRLPRTLPTTVERDFDGSASLAGADEPHVYAWADHGRHHCRVAVEQS